MIREMRAGTCLLMRVATDHDAAGLAIRRGYEIVPARQRLRVGALAPVRGRSLPHAPGERGPGVRLARFRRGESLPAPAHLAPVDPPAHPPLDC
jgi:hypothetical protein